MAVSQRDSPVTIITGEEDIMKERTGSEAVYVGGIEV